MSSSLLINCNITTLVPGQAPYGLLEDGAIAIENEKVMWCGSSKKIPHQYNAYSAVDLSGRLVTPGLIDCHTHIIFAGNRANEFEMRLAGASYEEIAIAGGGIAATIQATRSASDKELLQDALARVDKLIAEGVCCIEIKSGYGLTIEDELRMLRVARQIETERSVRVKTSLLAAHSIPVEYQGRTDDYLHEVCFPALKIANEEGLVDAVDGFCETIAFSPQQMKQVFEYAHKLDIPVKLHAEQLSNSGGAILASEYQAISADHLEYIDESGVKAMAASGTTAVLLPGAFYNLNETQQPPIDLFRKHNVSIAVATDCNPGSSPLYSILLAANMACTLFGLTPEEALAGITRDAAKALAMNDMGIIAAGLSADLAIWDVEHPAELVYRIGFNPLYKRVFRGKI